MKPRNALLVFLVSTTVAAAGSRGAERDALKKTLESVIEQSTLKAARVSVQVQSLDDGSIVFSRDADELLNPASNVKLYTGATALARLGPEYRFETEFLVDPEFRDGRAKVLYIRGHGDPSMTTERLYGVVGELVHAGLKEVQDIVVDDAWFDGERLPPGFDQESGDRAYLAPTGALSLNWNTVAVYLRPSDQPGKKATVEVEPPSEYFVVTEQLSTGNKTQRRFTVSSSLDKDRVHQKIDARGVVPAEKGTWSVWKKIDQPALYFGFTVKALLTQRGVKIKGKVRPAVVPPGQKMLHVAQSETLDIVLKRLNKNSSNFVAEQLIKTMGAEAFGAPGSHAKGVAVVEEFLDRDVGIARGTYVMRNGSGLNDANRFSAAQTNRLLMHMMKRFPVMPEFVSSVGIAGKDGTLKYRFDGSDAVGRLRAKTGTLESVSALSGYVESVGGERFVFSIMVNDFPGRAGTVVPNIDALGAAVAAIGSQGGPSAAVAAMKPASVLGSFDDLKSHLKTYVGLAQQGEQRNVALLRTAFRSEKDPAVRALIADALYQSDPRESVNVRMLIDSALPSEEVFGRIKRASLEAGFDLAVVPSVVELAAAGNVDAASRLLEFARADSSDERGSAWLSEQLAVVATDAPQELLLALKSAPEVDRQAAVEVLAHGLLKGAPNEGPLWAAIKQAQASPDPAMSVFARGLESTLALEVNQAQRAQTKPAGDVTAVEQPSSGSTAPTPGG